MIVFREEDVAAGAEFGGDWRAVAVCGEFGVVGGNHLARGGFLRSAREIDGRAVLRADIIALAHALGRVMALKEQFHEVRESDFGGVEDDLDDLGMAGAAGADFFIGRVRGDAASIADTGQPDALGLPEDALGAPEAAEAEDGGLVSGRGVRLDRAAVDEMGRGGRDRPGAAGQGGVTGRQGSGLAGEEHRLGIPCCDRRYGHERPKRQSQACEGPRHPLSARPSPPAAYGEVAEWSMAHAWKVCRR